MNNEINVYAVVKKLVGEVEPIGETNEDEKRLENLKKEIELCVYLLDDIQECALYASWNEHIKGDQMRKTNKTLLKKDIDEITIQTFRDAVFLCYKVGITSIAPLGCSGDTILLHGDEENGRESVVSIRNYSGDAELLITDKQGKFLFYGIFSIDLNIDFVVNQY